MEKANGIVKTWPHTAQWPILSNGVALSEDYTIAIAKKSRPPSEFSFIEIEKNNERLRLDLKINCLHRIQLAFIGETLCTLVDKKIGVVTDGNVKWLNEYSQDILGAWNFSILENKIATIGKENIAIWDLNKEVVTNFQIFLPTKSYENQKNSQTCNKIFFCDEKEIATLNGKRNNEIIKYDLRQHLKPIQTFSFQPHEGRFFTSALLKPNNHNPTLALRTDKSSQTIFIDLKNMERQKKLYQAPCGTTMYAPYEVELLSNNHDRLVFLTHVYTINECYKWGVTNSSAKNTLRHFEVNNVSELPSRTDCCEEIDLGGYKGGPKAAINDTHLLYATDTELVLKKL